MEKIVNRRNFLKKASILATGLGTVANVLADRESGLVNLLNEMYELEEIAKTNPDLIKNKKRWNLEKQYLKNKIKKEEKISPEQKNINQYLPKNREMRFGVASDIHGERGKAEKVASLYLREDVDAILIPGDFSNYAFAIFNIGEERNVINSLAPFLDTKKPVYVIPGNHESKAGYRNGIKDLSKKYDNLFDLEKLKHVNLNGLNLLGVPGGDIPAFGGYQIKSYIKDLEKDIKRNEFDFKNEPILMVSHMPPKFEGAGAIDCVYDVIENDGDVIRGRHKGEEAIYAGKAKKRINPKNRGLRNLTRLYKNGIDFSVSGHFHGNWGASDMERTIPTKQYARKLHINPGAVKFDRAGFFTFKNGQANYELFKVS